MHNLLKYLKMKKRYVVRVVKEECDRLEGLMNLGREATYRRQSDVCQT